MRHSARTRKLVLAAFASGLLAVSMGGLPHIVWADAGETGSSAASKGRAARGEAGVRTMTPAREAAAMTFARRHHPELADLLERLKRGNRRQYRRAILELFRTSERLARVEERDPERYEMALELWKLDSRIQLRAARMAMSDDPELEDEVKALLLERHQWRIRQLMLERDRAQARLERLNKNLSAAQKNPELAAERELRRLKRQVGSAAADARKNRQRRAAERRRKSGEPSAEPPERPSRKVQNP